MNQFDAMFAIVADGTDEESLKIKADVNQFDASDDDEEEDKAIGDESGMAKTCGCLWRQILWQPVAPHLLISRSLVAARSAIFGDSF